jgi:leucyl-tRNA synthetase
MQKNWIGKSSGAFFDFAVVKAEGSASNDDVIHIRTFTTRPDTVYGVSFLALAPEHPLLQKVKGVKSRLKGASDLLSSCSSQICPASERESLSRFQEAARKLSDLQRKSTSRAKLSLDLIVKVVHPFTGEHVRRCNC